MEKTFDEVAEKHGIKGAKLLEFLKLMYKRYPTWVEEKNVCESGAADEIAKEFLKGTDLKGLWE